VDQKLPHVGAGAKNLDAWSWSPKFKFRLHSPGCHLGQLPPGQLPSRITVARCRYHDDIHTSIFNMNNVMLRQTVLERKVIAY